MSFSFTIHVCVYIYTYIFVNVISVGQNFLVIWRTGAQQLWSGKEESEHSPVSKEAETPVS